MTSQAGIRDFAIEQVNRSLTMLAERVQKAAQKPGVDEIHDLRVSIRRFWEGLQLFDDFFPEGQVEKIGAMLKSLMRLTSAIRDRDITLEFLADAGQTEHRPRVEKERLTYQRQFSQMLKRWSAQDFLGKWRSGLALRNV